MDWFLYNGHLRHEKVELKLKFHLTHFRPIFPISIPPSEKWVVSAVRTTQIIFFALFTEDLYFHDSVHFKHYKKEIRVANAGAISVSQNVSQNSLFSLTNKD